MAGGRIRGDVLLLLVVVIWSGNYSSNRYGVTHGLDPLVFGALRYTIAAVVFVAVTLVREGSIRPRREDWLVLGVFAVFATLVNQLAFFYAIHLATASTVSLVFGALPAFVGMIGIVQGLRRPSKRHWLATAISFGGVALVAVGGSASLSGDLGGVLLALVAVGCYALYTVAVSRLPPVYSPYRISALISVGVALPLLALSSPKLASTDWSAISGLTWLSLFYSTVVGFIIANVMWIAAIKRTGPNRSSLFANLQVFGGAAVGVLLLSESMSGLEIAGGAVIAVGIILSARRLKLPTRGAPQP